MSMKTSNRQVNGVTIVDCSGRITLGEGSVTCTHAPLPPFLAATPIGSTSLMVVRVLTSCSAGYCERTSSRGDARTTVRNQGGELKLLNLTKKVHDLLQITKLYTVFDVKDDEAGAVKSFS